MTKGKKPIRSINLRKKWIQAKATSAAKLAAYKSISHCEPEVSAVYNSTDLSNPLAVMTGTASKNENRAAASLDKLQYKAAVMVIPDLEVPGISANSCAIPIKRPAFHVNSCTARVTGFGLSEKYKSREKKMDEIICINSYWAIICDF